MNLSFNSSQLLYGTFLGAFWTSALVNINVPIFTSAKFGSKIASKMTINKLLIIER